MKPQITAMDELNSNQHTRGSHHTCLGNTESETRVSCFNNRILLVENDGLLRRKVADWLAGWGCVVETASDAIDALQRFPSFDPLVVISDSHTRRMPVGRLVQAIRYGAPDVNCIILTDSPDSQEAADAMRHGASALPRKPPEPEQLRAQVDCCLRNGAPV